MSFGDKNADKTTIGLVMVVMDGKAKDEPYQAFGHTAVMFRRAGKVETISGWRPTAEPSLSKAVDGAWQDDIDMLKCKAAESFELEVSDNELTLVQVHLVSKAAGKWKYFFLKEEAPADSGRVFVKDNNKNCVEAALHIMRREPTPKTVITKINVLRDKIKANELRVFGYSQSAAMMEAQALQKNDKAWL